MDFGFGFSNSKSKKIKFIRKYVQERVKEKQILQKQLKRLDAQLKNDELDPYTFARLKDVIEINFIKQREEALEKAFKRK